MTGSSGRQTTRDRIVYAALRVMGEHGIAGLTNRRVAGEAAISLGSLTYHFASQHELLRESLLVFVEDETRRIQEIADSLQPSVHTLAEAAAAAERALAEMVLGPEEIGVYEVYVHSARDPELHTATRQCFAAYERVATTTLELLGVADPARLAPHVVALVAGSQLRRLATGAADAGGTGGTGGTGGIADGLLLLLTGAAATNPVAR